MIEIHRKPTLNNEIIMEMSENGAVLALASAVSHLDGTAEIINIDGGGCDLAKALLNAIDLMGIKTVTCKNAQLDSLLRSLKFNVKNDIYELDLTDYFCSNC